MQRIFWGGLLAAIVVFGWGMASWMVLKLHDGTIRELPEEWIAVTEVENRRIASGVYAWPLPGNDPPDADSEERQLRREEFERRFRAGPLVTVFYRSAGDEPFSPQMLGSGFAVDLIAAWIAAVILHLSSAALLQYVQRVLVVGLLGAFTAVVAHGGYFVWMSFDLKYSLIMSLDVVVGWLLAGLVLGAIVKELPPDLTDPRPLLRPPGVELE